MVALRGTRSFVNIPVLAFVFAILTTKELAVGPSDVALSYEMKQYGTHLFRRHFKCHEYRSTRFRLCKYNFQN